MHFWGQSAWLRITNGDLVGKSCRPRLSKLRDRPDHTQGNIKFTSFYYS